MERANHGSLGPLVRARRDERPVRREVRAADGEAVAGELDEQVELREAPDLDLAVGGARDDARALAIEAELRDGLRMGLHAGLHREVLRVAELERPVVPPAGDPASV